MLSRKKPSRTSRQDIVTGVLFVVLGLIGTQFTSLDNFEGCRKCGPILIPFILLGRWGPLLLLGLIGTVYIKELYV